MKEREYQNERKTSNIHHVLRTASKNESEVAADPEIQFCALCRSSQ